MLERIGSRAAEGGGVDGPVEAELATREVLCRLDNHGDLAIPDDALGRSDLDGDGRDDFILTLCRLACTQAPPKTAAACDQSLIFLSGSTRYDAVRMPGEVLDIRRIAGQPAKLLSSFTAAGPCPVADGVCNQLYEIGYGELIEAGVE